MISDLRAKTILENPDGSHTDDLAEVLLWSRGVNTVVMKYIHFLIIARFYRESGAINRALEFEKICQVIYDHDIPKHLRW